MRVLVLTQARTICPPNPERYSARRALEFRTERHVLDGLRKLGHEALQLGISDSMKPLDEALEEFRPSVVLNLLMEVDGRTELEPNVAAYLELVGVPFTGCGPRALTLARDKATVKQVLDWNGIRTPDSAVVARGERVRADHLGFPLIVKPACAGGSAGIAQASVVRDTERLRARVDRVLSEFGGKVVVERYVEGRELTVGLVGNARPTILPVRETFFGASRGPRIATWLASRPRPAAARSRRCSPGSARCRCRSRRTSRPLHDPRPRG